jgi:hypothetical protein
MGLINREENEACRLPGRCRRFPWGSGPVRSPRAAQPQTQRKSLPFTCSHTHLTAKRPSQSGNRFGVRDAALLAQQPLTTRPPSKGCRGRRCLSLSLIGHDRHEAEAQRRPTHNATTNSSTTPSVSDPKRRAAAQQSAAPVPTPLPGATFFRALEPFVLQAKPWGAGEQKRVKHAVSW